MERGEPELPISVSLVVMATQAGTSRRWSDSGPDWLANTHHSLCARETAALNASWLEFTFQHADNWKEPWFEAALCKTHTTNLCLSIWLKANLSVGDTWCCRRQILHPHASEAVSVLGEKWNCFIYGTHSNTGRYPHEDSTASHAFLCKITRYALSSLWNWSVN